MGKGCIMAASRGKALVVDSQPLNRAGMVSMLEKEIGFGDIITKSDLASAQAVLASDANILFAAFDLDFFGDPGLESLRRIRLNSPDLHVVILASAANRSQVLDLLEAGAHGIVPRTLATSEMIDALKAVANGAIYVPRHVAQVGEDVAFAGRTSVSGATRFTGRQLEVLELLALGKTNKEIGRTLRIADGTVKVHISAVFRLLGVRNRMSAVATLQACVMANAPPHPSAQEHQLRRASDR